MLEQGKSVRGLPSKEEGVRETVGDKLTTSLVSLSVLMGEVENSGVQLRPVKGGRWGEGVKRFVFVSYYPTVI